MDMRRLGIRKKIISMGAKVCMLPKTFDAKDINELWIKYSLTKDALMNIIKENTYQGLEAELQFMIQPHQQPSMHIT